MDKTNLCYVYGTRRSGFALIITLSVLAVLIALTTVLLSYFDEVRQDASNTEALIQADVYYTDIIGIFKRFKNKKTLFSTLYQFPVPLHSDDNRFAMTLYCQPLAKGININWLGYENRANASAAYSSAQMIFDTLAQEYNFQDAGRLQEMLMEEIGGKEKYVSKEYSRLRQKNAIISYKQFAQIVSRYQLEVDDSKISRVPWKKYFSFSPTAKVIDIEYSSAELIALLFDIDLVTVREWHGALVKDSVQTFVQNNGGDYSQRKNIITDNKVFLEESECSVSYLSAGQQYRFNFEYIQGEAKHFEFYEKH
ncbi:MAG: hypothetical protein DRQ78_04485 [Epsilonproteobacteria bacterium]|nr:MAG: hypothetical protein DRQ78_04485 [Campylobacterota bacterium]